MRGAIAVIIGFLLLPGSVIVLLAANFGALKGYLIGATSFFGFLFMLTLIWTFGVPGTVPLTGPVGPQPTFKVFTVDSPEASRFDKVRDFTGGAGSGWQAVPSAEQDKVLNEELTAAKQLALNEFIEEFNKDVEDSAKEVDVTNLAAETFYVEQDGTEVAATVISPANPPEGTGLQRPTFQPVNRFAWRDAGFPNLYNYIFMAASALLTALHILALGRAERRNPLGPVTEPTPAEATPRPIGAQAGRPRG
jgi:hypothetical protein